MSATGIDGGVIPVRPWLTNLPPRRSPALWFEASSLVEMDAGPVGGRQVPDRPGSGPTMTPGGRATVNGKVYEIAFSFYGDPPEPVLVVRRVGRLARIEDLAGVPYSEPMPIPEAISMLREIIE